MELDLNKKEKEKVKKDKIKKIKERSNIIKRKGLSFFERILIRHTNWLIIKIYFTIYFNFYRFCEVETKKKEAWFSFLFYFIRDTDNIKHMSSSTRICPISQFAPSSSTLCFFYISAPFKLNESAKNTNLYARSCYTCASFWEKKREGRNAR